MSDRDGPGGSSLLVAAAVYNAAWGLIAIVAPRRLARLQGFDAQGASTARDE